MKTTLSVIMALLFSGSAQAEIIVPVRVIRAQEVLQLTDLVSKPVTVPGAYTHTKNLVGLEARKALYPGRPIRPGDVGTPAVIDRNDAVKLIHGNGSLQIETDGRALGRGAVGESIQVMNLSSRVVLFGRIRKDGVIIVE